MAKNAKTQAKRFLLVSPPMPYDSPLLSMAIRTAYEIAKMGFDLIPVQIETDKLDVDALADSAS